MPRSALLKTIELATGGFRIAFVKGFEVVESQVDLSVLYYLVAYLFDIAVLAGIILDKLKTMVEFKDGFEYQRETRNRWTI